MEQYIQETKINLLLMLLILEHEVSNTPTLTGVVAGNSHATMSAYFHDRERPNLTLHSFPNPSPLLAGVRQPTLCG
jgi:hypothetical protein